MNRKLLSTTGLVLAAVLFTAVNIVANNALTAWRLDVTENQLFTLSQGTRNILKDLKEPISLKFYFSSKLFSGIPTLTNYGQRIRDMLEEYAAKSNGRLSLTVIDPEPFSEAEDQAVGYGIKQLPISAGGDMGYLGLVGANTTDDEGIIPVFHPNKEESLEYELTKLIYNLAHPKKRVIGVVSSLPVLGGEPIPGQRPPAPWTVMTTLKEAFEVRDLGANVESIAKDIDTLMVIHPKNLTDDALYAIDQFVLKGGKAMVFVDPFAEGDQTQPDPQNPMVMPSTASDLPKLFEKWGVKLVEGKVAGDIDAAIRVNAPGPRGPQEIEYLPWLRLGQNNLNRDDFVTNELDVLNIGSAGVLEKVKDAKTTFTPLLSTGPRSMPLEVDAVRFARDPTGLLESFKPENKSLLLAARVSGPVKTAFPEGKPGRKEKDPEFIGESKGAVNLVVVADTDLLSDRFWVQVQNFLGLTIPSAFADNADFVVNTLDNLGGNDDLISLRSRGVSARPFDRVEAIQQEAEAQFRDKEKALRARLEETENKIGQLQQQKEGQSALILSPEQRKEIEAFRAQQVQTRKELRAVQHDLQKNIEGLGTLLKFVNIGLIPVLIGLLAIGMGVARWNRQRTA
jgi:ABC-type uncharacterized transport system involved in gliding motility auxiliary subunit